MALRWLRRLGWAQAGPAARAVTAQAPIRRCSQLGKLSIVGADRRHRPDHFTVSATVDDTEIAQIKQGLQAVVTPNGATTPVYGTVTSVGLIATSTSGVTSYPVTIAVTGAQPTLHPTERAPASRSSSSS